MDDIEEGWTKRVALDGAATINVFPILVPQPFLLPVTDRGMRNFQARQGCRRPTAYVLKW